MKTNPDGAPEAEVVALSEALMPAVIIHESCRDIGLEVGLSPEVLFVVKTDSQVTLTQLRNESVTTRSRPFANKFNYARDMCHGTSMHPASVKAVFEPGRSQKADGLTKVLAGASMKSFVSDLGLAPLHSMMCNIVPQTTMVEESQGWFIHIEVAARILVAVPPWEAPCRSLSLNPRLIHSHGINGSLFHCVDPYRHWWCPLSAILSIYGHCWTRHWSTPCVA